MFWQPTWVNDCEKFTVLIAQFEVDTNVVTVVGGKGLQARQAAGCT